jgi:tetratricopeptide (TPR) repeat protein
MVKPITSRPIPVPDDLVDDEPVVSRRDPRSERSPSISPEDRARVTPDPDSEDSGPRGRVSVSEDSPAVAMPRRSTAWPIVATLGALCGAALVFGVPQIRQALFAAGDSGANDGVAPQPVAELDAARRALATAEPAALAEADAALSARLDQGVSDETAAWLRLAQAEVVATRAIWSRLLATVERDRADASRFEADDLAVRAAKLLVEAEASVLDPRAVARARARVKVAEGSPLASVLAGLRPDDAELELLVTATRLWREPQAPVPSGLVGGLMGLEEPSELARCVLAFAYLRSGDEAGARAIVDSLMLSASPPPVAIALSLRLDALEDPERAAEGAEPVAPEEPDSRSATDDERAKPDDGRARPDDEDDHDKDESSGDDDAGPGRRDPDEAGSRSGGMSVSRMIDIGCERVDSGNAKEGLVLLEKALDQRFNDPDVSLCIGLGYLELGRPRTALVAYERALKQAPRLGGALRGAARAAKRSGQTDKAINYYRRVLEIEPRNAEARAFIDQHAGPSDDDGQ